MLIRCRQRDQYETVLTLRLKNSEQRTLQVLLSCAKKKIPLGLTWAFQRTVLMMLRAQFLYCENMD
jgi:hypothetical protein